MSAFGAPVDAFDGLDERLEQLEFHGFDGGAVVCDPLTRQHYVQATVENGVMRDLLAARTADRNALDDALGRQGEVTRLIGHLVDIKPLIEEYLEGYAGGESMGAPFLWDDLPLPYITQACGLAEGYALLIDMAVKPYEDAQASGEVVYHLEVRIRVTLMDDNPPVDHWDELEDVSTFDVSLQAYSALLQEIKESRRGLTYRKRDYLEGELVPELIEKLTRAFDKQHLDPIIAARQDMQ